MNRTINFYTSQRYVLSFSLIRNGPSQSSSQPLILCWNEQWKLFSLFKKLTSDHRGISSDRISDTWMKNELFFYYINFQLFMQSGHQVGICSIRGRGWIIHGIIQNEKMLLGFEICIRMTSLSPQGAISNLSSHQTKQINSRWNSNWRNLTRDENDEISFLRELSPWPL